MTDSIDIQELESLIKEVGESIYLINKNIKEEPDFNLGIPRQYQYNQKLEVIGYTLAEKKTIFINGDNYNSEGDLTLYILENQKGNIYSKLTQQNTICFIRGYGYSFELRDIIYNQSKPIIYKLKIEQSQTDYESDIQNKEYSEAELSSKETIENAFDF